MIRHALLAALFVLAVPLSVAAQNTEPSLADTVVVAPGPDYEAGGLHRFLWGAHYRDAWTTSIRVPVLDLGEYAGGLTPLSAGGGLQTRSLWLQGADGRPYAFRSVYKNAELLVPEVFKDTYVEDIAQDQMSTQFPAGALVADSILQAAGVPHTRLSLFVLPDDESLGRFREEFASVLGLLQERPVEGAPGVLVVANARRVIESPELMELVQNSPNERVDSRAYLRVRLLDVLLGDWDRHPGQWNWADFGRDSTAGWRPIPRDRDQVFARFDGLLPSAGRVRFPALSSFGPKYDKMLHLHYNARFTDRRFLTELEGPVWDSTAAHLSALITDDVIDGAVGRLPPEIQAVSGEFLTTSLRSRRDKLTQAAADFYALMAKEPYVHATNADEIAEIEGTAEGTVSVSIRADSPGSKPYFRRTFMRGETKEIRVYLHGGADRAVIRSTGRLPVLVRIIGGSGDDEFAFEVPTGNIKLYDFRGENRVTGEGTAGINTKPYPDAPLIPPPASKPPPQHWGGLGFPTASIGYNPDYLLILGSGYNWYDYGFRKDPYASLIKLDGAVAVTGRAGIFFQADFRHGNSQLFNPVGFKASSLEILHFFGIGNDTELPPGLDSSDDFFDVEFTVVRGEGGLGIDLGSLADLVVGVEGGFAHTEDDDPDRIIGALFPDLYGVGDFTSAGTFLRFDLETSQPGLFARAEPKVRASFHVKGSLYPAILDVVETYGTAEAAGAVRVPIGLRRSEIGFRVGGKKTWGLTPWYDLAFIGGLRSLRGWRTQRFAGDASLYGSGELRVDLFDYRLLFPSTFGILGLYDIGRVWVDGESPGGWHTGYGGGIWIALRGTRSALSIAYATSTEDSGLYVTMGFAY